MSEMLQTLFNGLSLGAMYALLALGFVAIFRATEVVTFAQAGLLMVSVYFMAYLESTVGMPFILAAILGIAMGGGVAAIIERFLIRPAARRSLIAASIATLAADIVLQVEITRRIGSRIVALDVPWGTNMFRPLGLTVPVNRVLALAALGIVITAFAYWTRRSSWGLALQAAAERPETAALMGVKLERVSRFAWIFAGGLAGLAGIFLTAFPSPGLSSTTGLTALAGGLPAAIIGGIDSTTGAIVGGLLTGIAVMMVQTYSADLAFLGHGAHTVIPFAVMVVVLMIRPAGLFGTQEVTRV